RRTRFRRRSTPSHPGRDCATVFREPRAPEQYRRLRRGTGRRPPARPARRALGRLSPFRTVPAPDRPLRQRATLAQRHTDAAPVVPVPVPRAVRARLPANRCPWSPNQTNARIPEPGTDHPNHTWGYQIGIATATDIPHTGDKIEGERCSQQCQTRTAVWKDTRSVDDKPRSRRPGHRGHGVDREQRTSPIQPAVPSPQNRQASPSDGRGTATAERHPSWITRTVRVGGKTVCALVSVVVLAVTGYAWNFIGGLS